MLCTNQGLGAARKHVCLNRLAASQDGQCTAIQTARTVLDTRHVAIVLCSVVAVLAAASSHTWMVSMFAGVKGLSLIMALSTLASALAMFFLFSHAKQILQMALWQKPAL